MTAIILIIGSIWIYAVMFAFTAYIGVCHAVSTRRGSLWRIVLAATIWPLFWLYVLIASLYDLRKDRSYV
jgi:uncharacterized membrane-anchored protein